MLYYHSVMFQSIVLSEYWLVHVCTPTYVYTHIVSLVWHPAVQRDLSYSTLLRQYIAFQMMEVPDTAYKANCVSDCGQIEDDVGL